MIKTLLICVFGIVVVNATEKDRGTFSMFLDNKDGFGIMSASLVKEKTIPSNVKTKEEKVFSLIDMFRGGCESGIGRHCANLGVIYETGQGGQIDIDKANKYYALACKYGVAKRCSEQAHVR